MQLLLEESDDGKKITEHTVQVLCSGVQRALLEQKLRAMVPPAEADVAHAVLEYHGERCKAAESEGDAQKQRKIARAFLKPLRERWALRGKRLPLRVAAAGEGPATFHVWIAKSVKKERLRSIAKCNRILSGIAEWPLGWMRKPGVVCYERAAGSCCKVDMPAAWCSASSTHPRF